MPEYPLSSESNVSVEGYDPLPVDLKCDFFGRTLVNPFILSASPMTYVAILMKFPDQAFFFLKRDGYDQMVKGLKAGWGGGILKTAFDGIHIHVPNQYMTKFNDKTFGNCDNVSDHPLDIVCQEIKKLRQQFPAEDKLIAASTGGSMTGNDDVDRRSWQTNSKKLEEAGT